MKYQHYYANDSVEAMLTVMDGEESPYLDLKGSKNKNLLKPIQCPNCSESNIPQSKFCTKCKFVLSFDAFNETLQEGEQSKKRLERLETRLKQGQ